jgi:type IV secretion system protein VirB9
MRGKSRSVVGARDKTARRFYWAALGCFSALSLCATVYSAPAVAEPITADSRIKTFVYNPNEVYTITTHYGYQSNIEFGPKESIDTISVGDRVSWQIIPAGRRLFIRAMEENAHTNMTVVTNLRAYQFDLRSSAADAVFGSAELTYVVRFFYPPTSSDAAISSGTVPPVTQFVPSTPMTPPPASVPAPVAAAMPAPAVPARPINYRYTYSGPNDIAPTKIYDDGKTTYFKLPVNQNPQIAMITSKGEEVTLPAHRTPDGLMAVDAIAPRFSLNALGRQVVVYNEAGGGGS